MDFGGLVPGFPTVYVKAMRRTMFQVSGFYFNDLGLVNKDVG